MPLIVSISHEITNGFFAAVGDFVYKISDTEEHQGPASVIVKKTGNSYELVIDENLYPTQLDGKTPLEYFHAPVVKLKEGKLTFKNFHIEFKK